MERIEIYRNSTNWFTIRHFIGFLCLSIISYFVTYKVFIGNFILRKSKRENIIDLVTCWPGFHEIKKVKKASMKKQKF